VPPLEHLNCPSASGAEVPWTVARYHWWHQFDAGRAEIKFPDGRTRAEDTMMLLYNLRPPLAALNAVISLRLSRSKPLRDMIHVLDLLPTNRI